jgi:hypothetical protein
MLPGKLEGAVVVDEPVEPTIERARGNRQNQHLMRACPERSLTFGAMIMAGTSASGPELVRRMARTIAGPLKRLHRGTGDDKVRQVGRHPIKRIDRALIGLDAARADRGQHGTYDREHRPAVVDQSNDELIEIASERAMWHGTHPTPALPAFRSTATHKKKAPVKGR